MEGCELLLLLQDSDLTACKGGRSLVDSCLKSHVCDLSAVGSPVRKERVLEGVGV